MIRSNLQPNCSSDVKCIDIEQGGKSGMQTSKRLQLCLPPPTTASCESWKRCKVKVNVYADKYSARMHPRSDAGSETALARTRRTLTTASGVTGARALRRAFGSKRVGRDRHAPSVSYDSARARLFANAATPNGSFCVRVHSGAPWRSTRGEAALSIDAEAWAHPIAVAHCRRFVSSNLTHPHHRRVAPPLDQLSLSRLYARLYCTRL
eukprot:IDg10784t1